jgi:histidyl-tRNA synthetase
MHTRPHPVKLFFSDPVYWADAGERKIRQTYHIGAETIGDASEVVDAELLFLAYKIVDSLGFHGYNIHINTLGDNNCRPAYIRALKDFYKNKLKKVCVKCRNNFKINILRLLECTDEPCRQAMQDAPQTVEFLDEECKTHFKHILEFLDSAQIPYILNPYLVRSQDYYTRTVFEFWPEEAAGGAPLVFGGRHDKLSDLIGGSKTPSAGWTLDLPAVISLLKEKNASVPEVGVKPKVFLVQLGEAAKRKSLLLFEDIRKSGVEIRFSLARDSIKSQLRIATRLGVKFTLIFGQKEAIEGTVILREMETGIQETIPVEKIIEELKKRLKK